MAAGDPDAPTQSRNIPISRGFGEFDKSPPARRGDAGARPGRRKIFPGYGDLGPPTHVSLGEGASGGVCGRCPAPTPPRALVPPARTPNPKTPKILRDCVCLSRPLAQWGFSKNPYPRKFRDFVGGGATRPLRHGVFPNVANRRTSETLILRRLSGERAAPISRGRSDWRYPV